MKIPEYLYTVTEYPLKGLTFRPLVRGEGGEKGGERKSVRKERKFQSCKLCSHVS